MDNGTERLTNMMKRMILLASILICLLAVCGCQNREIVSSPSATIDILIPMETPLPTGIPTPEQNASERFCELDQSYFQKLITNDSYTLHMFLTDPAAFGIDTASDTVSWGTYSAAQQAENLGYDQDTLEALGQIDREKLKDSEQLNYDVLEEYLSAEIAKNQYPYYDEPLSPYSGFHASLPLILSVYRMETKEDAEGYLALLNDVPRCFGELLVYEQEKAANGLFMTKSAYQIVTDECDALIHEGKNGTLAETFSNSIDKIEALSAEDRKALIGQNESILISAVIPAYQTLRDGLAALEPECREDEGMYALGDDGQNYYAACLNSAAGMDSTPEEVLSTLESSMYDMLVDASVIRMEHPNVEKELTKELTTGDTDSDLKYLRSIAEGLFGTLSDHTLEVLQLPEVLRESLSSAYYLKSTLDHWDKHQILVNSKAKDTPAILVLAHEAYPGHLYQTVSARSNTEISYTRQLLNLDGYEEGWAQIAEWAFIETQGQFSRDALLVHHYDTTILYTILPAIVSIKVNAQGESLDEIRQYLTAYNIEKNAEAYYQEALLSPTYYLPYAVGYCELSRLVQDAKNDLGDAFNLGQFLKQYLSYGPAQSDILKERMDIWTDDQVLDE